MSKLTLFTSMPFTLPPLPWDKGSLKLFSKEAIEFHYDKHNAGYVDKLNAIVSKENENLANMSLEEIILQESGKPFNLAGQIWNHNFFWFSLTTQGGGPPTGAIAKQIVDDFGSFEKLQTQFLEEGRDHFGSGWVWLKK